MKYTVALVGRLLINVHSQKPTKNSLTVERGGATIGERVGCANQSFGGNRVGSMLNTIIKSLSLQIIIFLCLMIRYTKILLP